MQRQGQAATKAFLGLLQSASPPITSRTSWKDVQSRLGSEPAFQAISPDKLQQILQSYQRAVAKLEAGERQRATTAFQVGPALFKLTHQPFISVEWKNVPFQHSSDLCQGWSATQKHPISRIICTHHMQPSGILGSHMLSLPVP